MPEMIMGSSSCKSCGKMCGNNRLTCPSCGKRPWGSPGLPADLTEIIVDGPTSIIETHYGPVKVSNPLRDKLEALLYNEIDNHGASPIGSAISGTIDMILDELHAAMMPRTGFGAVTIGRIKRGEI